MQESHLKTVEAYRQLKNINAQSHAIRTAVKNGVIGQLREGQRTLEQLASACEVNPEPLKLLLEVLKQSGLVEQYEDDYALAHVGQVFPSELEDLGDRYWEHLDHWLNQGETIPSNKSTELDHSDFEVEHSFESWLSTPAALETSEVLGIGKERKGLQILDLYCGSGVFSLVILHQDSTSRATMVDRPERMVPAKQHAGGLTDSEYIQWIEQDPADAEFPESAFDLCLVARHIHRLPAKQLPTLFSRISRALKPGGTLAIVDIFPGQEKGELSRVVSELELALRTDGQAMHTPALLQEELTKAGYKDIQFAHLPAPPQLYGILVAKNGDAEA